MGWVVISLQIQATLAITNTYLIFLIESKNVTFIILGKIIPTLKFTIISHKYS